MVIHNMELQKEYDRVVNTATKESILMRSFDLFGDDSLYFASGQSAYFNKQIEEKGLNDLRIDEYDAETLRQLYLLVNRGFGRPKDYGVKGTMLYVCAAGTGELDYSRQSFPSGILEDIFGWSRNRIYPWKDYTGEDNTRVDFVVGEEEADYWMRVVEKQIEDRRINNQPLMIDDKALNDEELEEFKKRVHSLFKRLCVGQNRIYFINILQVLNNRVSGFAEHLRTGQLSAKEYDDEIAKLSTIDDMINRYQMKGDNFDYKARQFIYKQKNGHSQWGLALFGNIEGDIPYVDVRTKYSLIQEYFRNLGYMEGEVISPEKIQELCTNQNLSPDTEKLNSIK